MSAELEERVRRAEMAATRAREQLQALARQVSKALVGATYPPERQRDVERLVLLAGHALGVEVQGPAPR